MRFPWRRAKPQEAAPASAPSPTVPEGELSVLTAAQVIERTRAGALIDALRVKLGFPARLFETGVLPVVHAYAEFAQMLPASNARDPVAPGGLFVHGIEAAALALDFRRGQILPKGAAPEVIGEQLHRWTYAVLIAALLHEVDAPLAVLRVEMRKSGSALEPWLPLMGALTTCCALTYCWEQTQADAEELRGKLPLLLFDRFVPTAMVEWLAGDAVLVRDLLRHLAGEGAGRGDALTELAVRAHTQAAGRAPTPRVPDRSAAAQASVPPAATESRRGASQRGPKNPQTPADDDFLEAVEEPEAERLPKRKAR